MNIDETIGERVHQRMWAAQVSQKQLAGVLGVDQAAVSRRLRGRTPWKASEVLVAAALLGVEILDLYPPGPVEEIAAAAAVGGEVTRGYGHSVCSFPLLVADCAKDIGHELGALQVAAFESEALEAAPAAA